MKAEDLKRAYPTVPEHHREAILEAARAAVRSNPARRPRLRLALAWCITMLLLMGTAAALFGRFGMRELMGGLLSPQLAARVVHIDQRHETEDFSVFITDALSDGAYLYVNMDFLPKQGGAPVFIMPRFEATLQGKPLPVDLEEMPFYAVGGFWLPPREGTEDAHHNLPHYSFGLAVYRDGGYQIDPATVSLQGADEEIVWTMRLHVLKPNWPVLADTRRDSPEDDDGLARFRDAYRRGQILLAYGFALEEFASVSVPEGMDRDAYAALPLENALVASDAFRLDRTLVSTFTTQKTRRSRMEAQTLAFEGFDVRVRRVEASLYSAQYDLELRATDGEIWDYLALPDVCCEILLDGALLESGQNLHEQPPSSGVYRLQGTVINAAGTREPGRLRIRLYRPGTAGKQVLAYHPDLDFELRLR